MLSEVLGDALAIRSAGQMEAAFTAALCACDGSPPLAANTALLERAEEPHERQAEGLHGWPHTSGQGTGCGHCRVPLYRAAWRAGLIWYGQDFVLEAVGHWVQSKLE